MPDNGSLNRAIAAASLVTQVTITTGVCALLGSLLDGRLKTGPWLFLLGTFGGFALGILRLFQALQRLDPSPDDDPPDHPP